MKKTTTYLLGAAALLAVAAGAYLVSVPSSETNDLACADVRQTDRAAWWREARFGMFIHWGLYSVAAGEWNGQEVDGIGEWIQNFARIPNTEYEKLVNGFTLAKYQPEEWVRMAKKAGVGYIVFTAKHHDGFCLYPSDYTDFDISRTAYKGDPLKELIAACRKYGLKVGIYYSHRQDWREEAAAYMKNEYDGHYGKPKSEVKPDLDKYIQEKALPQVRELLTRYGKIDLLWYDTPFDLSYQQSKVFVDVVRELQPDCVINGRVGFDLGDYGQLGDNELPCTTATKDLEMIATLNHTWGYKKNDHNWKAPKDILCSLIECVSRNVNYMLNIGPREDGTVPQPTVDIMNYMAKWMKVNSEAIYGTKGNPFNDNFPWGYVASKEDCLYLFLTRKPHNGSIQLKALHSKVEDAVVLGTNQGVKVENKGYCVLTLPEGLDYDQIPVIKLRCQTPFRISSENLETEGRISVPAAGGKIVPGEKDGLRFSIGGVTENFNPSSGKLVMHCMVEQPGTFQVKLYTNRHWRRTFAEGSKVTLRVGDTTFHRVTLHKDRELVNVRQHSYPEVCSEIGKVTFTRPGRQTIELSVDTIGTYHRLGLFGEDIRESDNNIRVMRIELERE